MRKEKFGQNTLSIKTPGFLELFLVQLLTPVAMFQFFTSALWLLDEYWQYTMFSLFNIMMFESMTVFQRLQTLKTLSGMSTKPYEYPSLFVTLCCTFVPLCSALCSSLQDVRQHRTRAHTLLLYINALFVGSAPSARPVVCVV